MMLLFPGVAGNPPMQSVDVKNLYYQMMPGEWRRAFLNSGQVITNNNYTLLSLQRFMTLQEEQNQADVARYHQQQQCVGRQCYGRQGHSPGRRSTAMDGGAASPCHRTVSAQPAGPPVQTVQVAAQPFYHGFPRPTYQGQRPFQGRAYHPYQCAPVSAQGHGRGRGRRRGRGPDIYQAQPPNLPPVVAEPNQPNGTPPNDLHFASDPYGQTAFLSEPVEIPLFSIGLISFCADQFISCALCQSEIATLHVSFIAYEYFYKLSKSASFSRWLLHPVIPKNQ